MRLIPAVVGGDLDSGLLSGLVVDDSAGSAMLMLSTVFRQGEMM